MFWPFLLRSLKGLLRVPSFNDERFELEKARVRGNSKSGEAIRS